jgi:hypothetical protein
MPPVALPLTHGRGVIAVPAWPGGAAATGGPPGWLLPILA